MAYTKLPTVLSTCDISFRHNRSCLCSEVHTPLPSHHPTTQPLPLIPLHLKRNSPDHVPYVSSACTYVCPYIQNLEHTTLSPT